MTDPDLSLREDTEAGDLAAVDDLRLADRGNATAKQQHRRSFISFLVPRWADIPPVLQFAFFAAIGLAASGVFDFTRKVSVAFAVAGACAGAFSFLAGRTDVNWKQIATAVAIAIVAVPAAYILAPGEPGPLKAPANLMAEMGLDRVRFSWPESSDDPEVEQYWLYCQGNRVYVGKVTNYAFDVKPGIDYDCYVVAVGAGRQTSAEVHQIVKIPPRSTTLLAPKSLKATLVAAHSVELSWLPGQGETPTSYTVFRGDQRVGEQASGSFVDTNLDSDTAYVYRVQAKRVIDSTHTEESLPSEPLPVRTLADSPPPPPGSPSAPADLAVKNRTQTSITLGWSAPGNGSGLGYEIVRDGSYVTRISATSFVDTGQKPSTSHTYQVRTVDSRGKTSPYSAVTASTLATIVAPRYTATLEIKPGYGVNLDDAVDVVKDRDLYMSADRLTLSAIANGQLFLLSARPKDNLWPVEYDTCQDMSIGTDVRVDELQAGTPEIAPRQLCVITSDGRRGMLQITKASTVGDPTMRFSSVVWEIPSP